MFARASTALDEFPGIFGEPDLQKGQPIRINLNEFSYKKSAEIFGEKEPADYVYQVVTGAVRSYKLLSDGRRNFPDLLEQLRVLRRQQRLRTVRHRFVRLVVHFDVHAIGARRHPG